MILQGIKGVLKQDYNLAHLTWFKVGGNAELFFKPEDEDDLICALKQFEDKQNITIIGAGSNIIIRDGGIPGLVIKLTKGFTFIEKMDNGNLLVGAGCLNFNLAKFAQASAIKNFEFLVGIPGSVGGGIAMNAGSYGSEFKDIVVSINAVDFDGNKHNIKCEDAGFAYRSNNLPKNLIFTSVEFKAEQSVADQIKQKMQEISHQRAITQPITEKTGGSTFANPEGQKAWQLIDKVGMRGFAVGGARISEKHCNFIINDGSATASDIEKLGEMVREKVKLEENIILKWEIKRVGEYEK